MSGPLSNTARDKLKLIPPEIQRGTRRPECVEAYRESFDLAMQIGDRPLAAVAALSLGNAHLGLRDLDEAERWYSKSLDSGRKVTYWVEQ